MRGLRGSVRFVASALLLTCLSSSVSAQLLVAAEPGSADAIAHAELAYAIGDGAPVTWISLRLSHGPVALVAALPEGAVADSALDAWFDALETTASPRVLVPRNTTNCRDGVSFVEIAWPRGAGAAPDELQLDAPEDVVAALAAQGVSLTNELPKGSSYMIWSWPELAKAATTRTLRIVGGSAPLSFSANETFPVVVSALTRGPMQYQNALERNVLDVTFSAGSSPRTDYRARVREWLGDRSEPLAETRSSALLFDWSIHGDLVSIAPLTRSYAERAAAELPELDAAACAAALGALRSSPSAASPTDCGSARDMALALSTADPALATLQRFVVSAARGVAPELLAGGGGPLPPLLRAHQLDDSACSGLPELPTVIEPAPGVSGPVAEPGGGSVVVEETIVVAEHEHVEVDCTGSPRPEPDDRNYYDDDERDDVDCSSDTSSSSDASSSDTTCSGDTSRTSESDDSDPDCSSDSSSSASDDDDASCDGGPSDRSADDDASCDGGPGDSSDDDDSYDGDTCTGSAAPGRTPQKSQAALGRAARSKRPERLKTSLWSLAFAALVLPIRRRKRMARAAS